MNIFLLLLQLTEKKFASRTALGVKCVDAIIDFLNPTGIRAESKHTEPNCFSLPSVGFKVAYQTSLTSLGKC